MSKDDKMKRLLNDELTDKETYFIGKIVAAWASLEPVSYTHLTLPTKA